MPELKATFTADDTQLSRKIGGIEGAFGRLGRMTAGLFGVGAVVGFTRSIAEAADAVQSVSDSTGISPTAIQSIRALGAESGVAAEKIETVLNRLTSAQTDAVGDAAGTAAKQFAKLGISVDDLRRLSPEKMIEAVGSAMGRSADDASAMAAAAELVGIRSKRMLTVLRQVGEDGLDSVNASMKASGSVMSDMVVSGLDEAGDRVDGFVRRMKTIGASGLFGLGRLVGLVPDKTRAEQMLDAEGNAATARAEQARRMRAMNEDAVRRGFSPIWDKFEAVKRMPPSAEALANQRQALQMGGVSDALIRIGGARGVDMASAELQTLRSIDQGIKRLGDMPDGLRW